MDKVKTPWFNNYGDVPHTLEYKQGSMWEAVNDIAEQYPDYVSYVFMGKKTLYSAFAKQVNDCAKALRKIGIKEGDRVTICMPNCPQGIIMFYAVNVVGAIANMIHPLSAEKEIAFYLNDSQSVAAITLDQFYPKFEAIRDQVSINNLIIADIKDALSPIMKLGYALTSGRKIKKIPDDAPIIRWNDFIKSGKSFSGEYRVARVANDPAVTLYSGGTTGVSKGILLSNLNFNALAAQIIATNPVFSPGDTMLAAMPIFHGFGLGVSIHSMLANGGKCVLVPRFTPASYAKLIVKYRCNFMAGVPTLYEALLRQPVMDGADLSCLKGVYSGGDSLSVELKKKLDTFLADRHATVKVREGYGTTECVTASCLTPLHLAKEGSIGQPFPDTFYKIVRPGTQEELPYGEDGEICLSGPTTMMEYVGHPDETAQTLQIHADGKKWVHTGDLGHMDEEGFIYFKQRIKRMIITSGYNVYPSQLENILDAHDIVQMSCIIGVPDPIKVQKIKAFVMLKPDIEPSDENKQILIEYCKKNIAKYALPYDIEFREQLPKTLVGKVAYRVLEEEENAKRAAHENSIAT
ncbi:MAG: long-chain fatty acid--CoA ligase [Ruminococcaceae bacterium]|nr:long-chain fatty acid--CoA ligase [Oscillospiraceae bacterium]